MILSKSGIEEAIDNGEIEIENIKEGNLEPASYDARLGDEAIVTREVDLEELKDEIITGTAEKINVKEKRGLAVPAGGLALVTTYEKISLSNMYAAHIGMKTYYVRKGLDLLSGLQIDPGFGNPAATLVLALKNESTREINLDYKDEICSIEFHQLNEPAPEFDRREIEGAQREGKIPQEDLDYLRSIEAMSISELTNALLSVSRTVESNNTWIKRLFIAIAVSLIAGFIVVLATALAVIATLV